MTLKQSERKKRRQKKSSVKKDWYVYLFHVHSNLVVHGPSTPSIISNFSRPKVRLWFLKFFILTLICSGRQEQIGDLFRRTPCAMTWIQMMGFAHENGDKVGEIMLKIGEVYPSLITRLLKFWWCHLGGFVSLKGDLTRLKMKDVALRNWMTIQSETQKSSPKLISCLEYHWWFWGQFISDFPKFHSSFSGGCCSRDVSGDHSMAGILQSTAGHVRLRHWWGRMGGWAKMGDDSKVRDFPPKLAGP